MLNHFQQTLSGQSQVEFRSAIRVAGVGQFSCPFQFIVVRSFPGPDFLAHICQGHCTVGSARVREKNGPGDSDVGALLRALPGTDRSIDRSKRRSFSRCGAVAQVLGTLDVFRVWSFFSSSFNVSPTSRAKRGGTSRDSAGFHLPLELRLPSRLSVRGFFG